jgi:ribulose bisphosphate carboxylase small subunit
MARRRRRAAGDEPEGLWTVSARLFPDPEVERTFSDFARRYCSLERAIFVRATRERRRPSRDDLKAKRVPYALPGYYAESALADAVTRWESARETLADNVFIRIRRLTARLGSRRKNPRAAPSGRALRRLRARLRLLVRYGACLLLLRQRKKASEFLRRHPEAAAWLRKQGIDPERPDRAVLRGLVRAAECRMLAKTVFGGRKRLRALARPHGDPAMRERLRTEWREARRRGFAHVGREREPDGNVCFRIIPDASSPGRGFLEVYVKDRTYLRVPYRTGHRYWQAFLARTPRKWTGRIVRRGGRWYLHASFHAPLPPPPEGPPAGAVGIDINAVSERTAPKTRRGRAAVLAGGQYAIAWVAADARGKILAADRIPFRLSPRGRRLVKRLCFCPGRNPACRKWKRRGARRRPIATAAYTRKFIESAVLVPVRAAMERGFIIAVEDLRKPRPIRGDGSHRALRRLMGRWPAMTVLRRIRRSAARLGVRVVAVDPRNTSKIGARIAGGPSSVHEAAAYVIALRALGAPGHVPEASAGDSGKCPGSSRGGGPEFTAVEARGRAPAEPGLPGGCGTQGPVRDRVADAPGDVPARGPSLLRGP